MHSAQEKYRKYGVQGLCGGSLEQLMSFDKPKSDPKMMEKALRWREQELQGYYEMARENERMKTEQDTFADMYIGLEDKYNMLQKQYSKLNSNHGRASTNINSTGSGSGVPHPQSTERGGRSGDAESGLVAVSREVLRTDVSDNGGQTDKHSAEERLDRGSDTEGDVRLREESVPEGGT